MLRPVLIGCKRKNVRHILRTNCRKFPPKILPCGHSITLCFSSPQCILKCNGNRYFQQHVFLILPQEIRRAIPVLTLTKVQQKKDSHAQTQTTKDLLSTTYLYQSGPIQSRQHAFYKFDLRLGHCHVVFFDPNFGGGNPQRKTFPLGIFAVVSHGIMTQESHDVIPDFVCRRGISLLERVLLSILTILCVVSCLQEQISARGKQHQHSCRNYKKNGWQWVHKH